MIIDNASIIAIVLDNAMNVRNAVIHNNIPFNTVMMFLFILSLIFEKTMLTRFLYFKKLSEVLFISLLTWCEIDRLEDSLLCHLSDYCLFCFSVDYTCFCCCHKKATTCMTFDSCSHCFWFLPIIM